MKFGCSIGIFLNSAHLICRSTDISKCFRGSLRLRDNESRLYCSYLKVEVHLMPQSEIYFEIQCFEITGVKKVKTYRKPVATVFFKTYRKHVATVFLERSAVFKIMTQLYVIFTVECTFLKLKLTEICHIVITKPFLFFNRRGHGPN